VETGWLGIRRTEFLELWLSPGSHHCLVAALITPPSNLILHQAGERLLAPPIEVFKVGLSL
jgi:hypothetical protein